MTLLVASSLGLECSAYTQRTAAAPETEDTKKTPDTKETPKGEDLKAEGFGKKLNRPTTQLTSKDRTRSVEQPEEGEGEQGEYEE